MIHETQFEKHRRNISPSFSALETFLYLVFLGSTQVHVFNVKILPL